MARSILHMLTPLRHTSPFDVNMAVDAGFEVIVPHTQVGLEDVAPLVQDAIFSRAPQDGVRTGVFIGGKSADIALDMMAAASGAFVPPFRLHLFADPAGSFTTGAAMVALVARTLREHSGTGLAGRRVAIFGGAGVVSYCAAVLAAEEGAHAVLLGHDGVARVSAAARSMRERFGVSVEAADGSTVEGRRTAIANADIVLSAAAAGVQVLDAEDLGHAPQLLVAADVNAVPPAGVAGVDIHARGVPLPSGTAVGVGALAIGDIKYKVQAGLLRRMLAADQPLALDFRDAYRLALEIAG